MRWVSSASSMPRACSTCWPARCPLGGSAARLVPRSGLSRRRADRRRAARQWRGRSRLAVGDRVRGRPRGRLRLQLGADLLQGLVLSGGEGGVLRIKDEQGGDDNRGGG